MAADPTKLKKAKELGRQDILFSLARQPESERLFFGSSDFQVYDVDLADEKPEARAMAGRHDSYVTGVALAGGCVVSGSYDGRLMWWDVESREPVRTVEAHASRIRNLVATPDATMVASVADDMVLRLWEAETGKLVREMKGHEPLTPHNYPSMLYAVNVSPDGKLLASGDKVGHCVVWELATGKQLAAVETPGMYTWDPKQRRHSIGGVRSVAFSPDGKLLAVGGTGKIGNIDHLEAAAKIEIFAWAAGERTHDFPGDKAQGKGLVEQMQFSRSGAWLAAAGGDHGGFVKFFDLNEKKLLKHEKAPMHVHALALNETDDVLYTVGHGKIVTWELKG